MARKIQQGETVLIEFEFKILSTGALFDPPGPIHAHVRYVAGESEGPFMVTRESEGMYSMLYNQTDRVGLYYVSVEDADEGYESSHFQVWRRKA